MKILVIVKHYTTTNLKEGQPIVEFDEEETYSFSIKNNIIKLNNSCWQKQINSLEDCFKAIVCYFKGTNYEIVDFVLQE